MTGDLRAQLQASLGTTYHLERELGGGGMSRVFLATDTTLGRRVVVKVLSPELAEGLSAERFAREMKVAAALQDPHIVPLLVSGESDGLPFFTMPYVEGESLRARLLRTDPPLAFNEIVGILRDVALALEYAHARGVVHRDIKPENVLLAGRTAVVADFGIAKALSAARTQTSGNTSGTLTSAGTSLGTPAYMAPEQAAGDPTDHRADLYAWGMMAYEMLAGRHPFASKTTAQALVTAQMVEMPPSLLKEKPGLPPPLAGVVMQCLAKEASGRPQSATELLQALDGIATPGTRTRPSVPAKSGGTGRSRWIGGALVVVALIAGGYAIGHRGPAGTATTSGLKRVAVLPFENLGDTTDAYFADGVANEVRTKLTALPSMQVTARASSMAYKSSTKSPAEIARELGVDYLLTGTVQWQKGAGGNRVHVTPELIQASTGISTWQQSFDAALTDVFKVQADIAGQVASALGVAIGAGDQQRLAERPTQNLSAYDAFLRGEAASQGLSVSQPAALRQAIDAYEQAVALDSSFVQAWAQLSRANSRIYQIGTSDMSAAARAKETAERALTLAPNRPEGHQALGQYYLDVVSDNAKGFTEDSIALAILPSNAELMATTARSEYHLGRWEQARQRLEEAARLDPRSIFTADHLGRVLLYTRRQDEARRAIDRAMQISPGNFGVREFGIMSWLAEGNMVRARAELAEGTKFGEPTGIVAYVATYYDLIWLLDDPQQQLLVRLTPSAFDNDRATWAIVLAQTYALRGDQARTRIYADSAQLTYTEQLKANPNDPQLHVLRGLALAYLGRKAEAVNEGETARRTLPIERDEYTGGYVQHQFARILIVNGDHERAIDMLEPLLHRPYFLTPAWLRIDPNFKPLKGNPRFERLVAGS